MNLKRFLKKRKRRKEMDKAFESILRRTALVNLKTAELELCSLEERARALSRKDDYSR